MLVFYCSLFFLIFTFSQQADTEPVQTNLTNPSQLYAGRTADFWISEVVRLAINIRNAEEDYDKNLGECMRQKSSEKQDSLPCLRANQAKSTAQDSRKEYQHLLDTVSTTSLPTDWLRAHFTWVRWGSEWKRN
jgi:hypothetical protein